MARTRVSRHRRAVTSYHPSGMDLEGTEHQPNRGRYYPASVPINEDIKYNPLTTNLMIKWRKEVKPFRPREYSPENIEQRLNKFRWLTDRLADIYDIPRPVIKKGTITEATYNKPGASGSSCYSPATNTITLNGKLSVLTLLHEFGHARGFDETDATMWSVNLFKRIFPHAYERLQGSGHTLVQHRCNNE